MRQETLQSANCRSSNFDSRLLQGMKISSASHAVNARCFGMSQSALGQLVDLGLWTTLATCRLNLLACPTFAGSAD